MKRTLLLVGLLALFLVPRPAFPQLGLPATARASLYFPQFADGGTSTEQWQTTFTFVNPYPSAVAVALLLYADDGSPLALDLGLGLAANVTFTIPGNGSKILRSRIAGRSVVTGWAVAVATLPVHGRISANYQRDSES